MLQNVTEGLVVSLASCYTTLANITTKNHHLKHSITIAFLTLLFHILSPLYTQLFHILQGVFNNIVEKVLIAHVYLICYLLGQNNIILRVFHRFHIQTVENYMLLSRTISTLPSIINAMKSVILFVSFVIQITF